METLSHPEYSDEYTYYTLSPHPYAGNYDLNYPNDLYFYNMTLQEYRAMEMNNSPYRGVEMNSSPYHANSYLYNYPNPYNGGSEYGIPHNSVSSTIPRSAIAYSPYHELAAPNDSAPCNYRSTSSTPYHYEKTIALQNRKRKAFTKLDNINSRKRRKKDSKINPKLKVLIQALRESVKLDYFKVLKEVNVMDINIPVEFSILSRKGFMDIYCKYCEGFKKPKNWENMYRNVSKQGYAKSNGKKFILDKSVYSVVAMLYKEFVKNDGNNQIFKNEDNQFIKSEGEQLFKTEESQFNEGQIFKTDTQIFKEFVKTEEEQ